MLKAYVRQFDGTTTPVELMHTGQHLRVQPDGKVRVARVYWERGKAQSVPEDGAQVDRQEAAGNLLKECVPLLDTLILTRVSAVNGERVVFHGLMVEVNADDEALSVIAADNPQADHLFDQPFWLDAPLAPSDSPLPEAPELTVYSVQQEQPMPPAQQTPAQGVPQVPGPQPQPQPQQFPQQQMGPQTLGGLPLMQAPHHPPNSTIPADPAARPGGHPAGHPAARPAGQWQPFPQAAAQAAAEA